MLFWGNPSELHPKWGRQANNASILLTVTV
jgi:hypothetical protein